MNSIQIEQNRIPSLIYFFLLTLLIPASIYILVDDRIVFSDGKLGLITYIVGIILFFVIWCYQLLKLRMKYLLKLGKEKITLFQSDKKDIVIPYNKIKWVRITYDKTYIELNLEDHSLDGQNSFLIKCEDIKGKAERVVKLINSRI